MVYNSTQWVSYMDPSNKAARTWLIATGNFGGVSDWAVDLEAFRDPPTPTISSLPDTASGPPTVQSPVTPALRSCDAQQKKLVLEAWQEAATMAYEAFNWSPLWGKWQPAMDMYMGPGSKNDWSWFTGAGPMMRKPMITSCLSKTIKCELTSSLMDDRTGSTAVPYPFRPLYHEGGGRLLLR
jgi:hypothetical protein